MKYLCTHCVSSKLGVALNSFEMVINIQVYCSECGARGRMYKNSFYDDFVIPKKHPKNLRKVLKFHERLQNEKSGEERVKIFQKYLKRIMKLRNGMLP